MTIDNEFDKLLDNVRRGDETAATDLFRRVQPRLLRYLRSQEPRVAEDIAADVWVTVASSLDKFDGDEVGFRAWVFTIARRRVVDHRRRGVRRRTSSVAPGSFSDRADDRQDVDPSTATDAQEAIDLVVALLPAVQAEVILLRVVADFDAETVAQLMGKSANWVRVTQHRALKKLASQLRRPSDVTP